MKKMYLGILVLAIVSVITFSAQEDVLTSINRQAESIRLNNDNQGPIRPVTVLCSFAAVFGAK